jgi:hypothetical protein
MKNNDLIYFSSLVINRIKENRKKIETESLQKMFSLNIIKKYINKEQSFKILKKWHYEKTEILKTCKKKKKMNVVKNC